MIVLTIDEVMELHEKLIVADGSIDYESIVGWVNTHQNSRF